MNSRERILTALNHEVPDRLPIENIVEMFQTAKEWRYGTGLPAATTNSQ